ncbi:MAG TPA: GNAT family N-acetyltransferase [Acidimicrobiales bacterium]|nr:GNAT family N-acetyltransferase [Acidimicrobiales bacterium]
MSGYRRWMVELRAADRVADMVALQRLASRLWPVGGHHPGGLGWALAIDEFYPKLVVAVESDGLVGWAGRSAHEADIHTDPERSDVAQELLKWVLGSGDDSAGLSIQVFAGEDAVCGAVAGAGFSLADAAVPIYGMFHGARAELPTPPAGYRIRGLASGEERARVEAHRAAWRPATLPLPRERLETVSADLTSKFTDEKYEAVRRAWLYDPDLDLVVEAPDGSFAGCCTLWWDPSIGVGEIEPLGVLPEHRRRGLATALVLTAAALVGRRGGQQVFINVGPRDDYPAPAATYAAAGFTAAARGGVWTRSGQSG